MQDARQAAAQAEEGEEEALTAPALDARAVRKRYGSLTALAGVDLRVEAGQVVGLLGPNGAGKSTLMKIACGLVGADDGEVLVDGRPAGSRAARERLGYLAELFRFPDWQTADEVLRVHQRLAGSRGGTAERQDLLARVGLSGVAGRRVGALSKGMQQRLGLAQSLVGDPRLVLLDEPTSALDPLGRATVRELLDGLRERGVAVLLNSHLLTEVEMTADRVALLREGAVVREAATADLLQPTGVSLRTRTGTRRHAGADGDDVPRLVREAVEAGEDVLDVRVDVPTLEEVYRGAMRGPG